MRAFTERGYREPPLTPGWEYEAKLNLYFDPATWDGSDVFAPPNYDTVLISGRIRDALKSARLSNVRLEEVAVILPPGKPMLDHCYSHPAPVWKQRGDCNILAQIEDGERHMWEQLWARRVRDEWYEICCVPFLVSNIALGDIVRTTRDEHAFVVAKVIDASGHRTFRVRFGEPEDLGALDEVTRFASSLGCLCESSPENLLAIDAPSRDVANRLADWLSEGQGRRRWVYEPGFDR